MHQSHFLSQVAETSEPSGNRNFTDLLTELRVAQVSCKGILKSIRVKIIKIPMCVKNFITL